MSGDGGEGGSGELGGTGEDIGGGYGAGDAGHGGGVNDGSSDPGGEAGGSQSAEEANQEKLDEERARAQEREQESYEWNSRQDKLEHIFANPEHEFRGLIDKYGSERNVLRQILDGLKGKVPDSGTFATQVDVGGARITVRGYVGGGVIKIGTAFIPRS